MYNVIVEKTKICYVLIDSVSFLWNVYFFLCIKMYLSPFLINVRRFYLTVVGIATIGVISLYLYRRSHLDNFKRTLFVDYSSQY